MEFQHVLHCVNWIRQALMCNADLNLDHSINDFFEFGNGNVHICKDFEAVKRWSEKNRFQGLKEMVKQEKMKNAN